MKNREIIEHINALNNFTKEKLPVKLSFAIVKNFNRLQDAYKDYDAARVSLFKQYADQNDENKIADENLEKWKVDIGNLLDIDVDVDVYKVDFSVLDGLELTVSDMMGIDFMINE